MNRDQLKRALLFCLVLVLLLAGIEKLVEFGVTSSNYSHYGKVNLIANHLEDPQVACFGSSVGEVAIDARLLQERTGFSTYNFAIDGTRFMQYNGLIEELNMYSTQCKLVVMAETFFSLSAIDRLTEPDRFMVHLDHENIYHSLYAIQPDLAWKMKYIPFYRFIVATQRYYKASFIGLKSSLTGSLMKDSLQGFTPKYKGWETGLDDLNRKAAPIEIEIDSSVLGMYKKTLSELRKKGRKVLIIIPPFHEDGLKLLPAFGKVRKTLSSLQAEGIYFRDYSITDLSREKKYFYNNSHVNAEGAKIFSNWLATTIDSVMKKPDNVLINQK